MIEYRKITIEEKESLVNLIDKVLQNLERKEFFIPFTTEEIDMMFDDSKVIVYGAYDNNKLVGTAQLYLSENYVEEIKQILSLDDSNSVAELGGALVLEEYRNKGIMKELSKRLIEEAKNKSIEYIVITVHPENIASNKAFSYTGAKVKQTVNLGEYLSRVISYCVGVKNNIK